jgi:hypothetical protein
MSDHCLDVARVAQGWLARRDAALACRILRLLIVYSEVFKRPLRQEMEVSSSRPAGHLAYRYLPRVPPGRTTGYLHGSSSCSNSCSALTAA